MCRRRAHVVGRGLRPQSQSQPCVLADNTFLGRLREARLGGLITPETIVRHLADEHCTYPAYPDTAGLRELYDGYTAMLLA